MAVACARTAPRAELAAEIAGCRAWESTKRCEVFPDSVLRVFVAGSDPCDVFESGRLASTQVRRVEGGWLTSFRPSRAPETVVLTRGRLTRAFEVVPLARNATIARAKELRSRGELDRARDAVMHAVTSTLPLARARASSLLARIEHDRGRHEDAKREWRAAMDVYRSLGRDMEVAWDGFALAHELIQDERRFDEADGVVEELSALHGPSPELGVLVPYYRGVIALRRGDLRRALIELETAERAAAMIGWDRLVADTWQLQSQALLLLGRPGEACAILERAKLLFVELSPLERAQLMNNLGWAGIAALESRAAGCPSPEESLLEARTRFKDLGRRDEEANTLTNLALSSLLTNQPDLARRRREESERVGSKDPQLHAWWIYVDAELARGRRDFPRAIELFDRLRTVARSALIPDLLWRGELGTARALIAMRRFEEGLEAYERTRLAIAEEAQFAPLGEGHVSFVARFDDVGSEHVALLLELHRIDAALDAAREYRAQSFDALRWRSGIAELDAERRKSWETAVARYHDVRARAAEDAKVDWTLPREELDVRAKQRSEELADVRRALEAVLLLDLRGAPARRGAPVRADELIIAYWPLEPGWAVFSRMGEGKTTVDRFDDRTAVDLAKSSLERLAERIHHAKRVRFLLYGALETIDMHALDFEGRPLAAAVEITYGLDLVRSDRPHDVVERSAVIIGDPKGDLPYAKEEAHAIADDLARRGFTVEALTRGDATIEEARRLLEKGASLFYFAGHARVAGRDGWDSGLLLADGALVMSDVLAMKRVPPNIVLAGCETGRRPAGGGTLGLGVAHTFLFAGAEVLIATTRTIDDRDAALLREVVVAGSSGDDLVAKLRSVQLAAIASGSRSDWSAARAITP